MKLSTRVRFGLRIMVQIAAEGEKEPVFARRIAAAQGISEPYVDQILMALRSGGLVISRRGRKGGYQLADAPENITALDVLETIEGDLGLVECVLDASACDRLAGCVTHKVWRQATAALKNSLSSVTLADLKQDYKKVLQAVSYVI
ncbi:MAG: Rrf2 family transcriptional regulator [Lentisphaeria bacterium]